MISWLGNEALNTLGQIVMVRASDKEQRSRDMESLRGYNRVWAEHRVATIVLESILGG